MDGRRIAVGVALVAVVATLGCRAQTDQRRYAPGDEAVAFFANHTGVTTWLGGCTAFHFERREAGEWTDAGVPHVCFWEGFAQPVEPGEVREDRFAAPFTPGLYRLHYPTGLECAADQPLSEEFCRLTPGVSSRPFQVAELCDPAACGPRLGMPNWLCPDGSAGGPTGRCLRDPETDLCGWEIRSCPDDATP